MTRRRTGLLLSAAAHAALAGAILAAYGTAPLATAPSALSIDLVATAPPTPAPTTPATPITRSPRAAAPAPHPLMAHDITQPPHRPARKQRFALAMPRQSSLPAPAPPAPPSSPPAAAPVAPPAPGPAAASAAANIRPGPSPTAAAPARATPVQAVAGPTVAAAPPAAWLRAIAAWLATHHDYPAQARRAGEQGTVLLRLVIARNGLVRQVSLLTGSGHADLDRASLAILRGARLPPSPSSGGPAELTLRVPIRYELKTSR